MAIEIYGSNRSREVIEQLPIALQRWLVLERLHLCNVGMYQDLSRDPTFDTCYLPQFSEAFELPCLRVRANRMRLFGTPRSDEHMLTLFVHNDGGDWVHLPVHPTALAHYRKYLDVDNACGAAEERPRIWAVPTSSTRTLLAWPDGEPDKAAFLKTSLYSRLFGNRRLDARALAHSVTLSTMVEDSREQLPEALDYLPEPLGMLARRVPDGGALIRSIPQQIKDGQVTVAPLFALMGGQGQHRPLLLGLLERSDLPVREFVREILCVPIANLWLALSLRHGLIIEAHAQDLLLQLTADGRPLGRFVYRDFEGLQVDWRLRASCSLQPPRDLPCAENWSQTYNGWAYRYGECVWYKWRTSLTQYLHRMLKDLESALDLWHKQGLVGGVQIKSGELTMMFSCCLMDAVERDFGAPIGARYDLSERKSMSRFVRLLMGVRRSLLQSR